VTYAVFVQSKFDSQRTPRRVVFIGGLPDGAAEGDVIQLGLPFGRMTNLVFAKRKCQVWWSLVCSYITCLQLQINCIALCRCQLC